MFTYYTVQRGDTLTSIAKKFGTSVALLQRINGISNPDMIDAGDMLIVPITAGSRLNGGETAWLFLNCRTGISWKAF